MGHPQELAPHPRGLQLSLTAGGAGQRAPSHGRSGERRCPPFAAHFMASVQLARVPCHRPRMLATRAQVAMLQPLTLRRLAALSVLRWGRPVHQAVQVRILATRPQVLAQPSSWPPFADLSARPWARPVHQPAPSRPLLRRRQQEAATGLWLGTRNAGRRTEASAGQPPRSHSSCCLKAAHRLHGSPRMRRSSAR